MSNLVCIVIILFFILFMWVSFYFALFVSIFRILLVSNYRLLEQICGFDIKYKMFIIFSHKGRIIDSASKLRVRGISRRTYSY